MTDFYTHWHLFGNAYITCILLAISCAFLGVYVVLRRIIFFGVAVIQLAALGVACSFLLGYNAILCATVGAFLGIALFLRFTHNETLISKENLIGIIYIASGAFSLLIIKESAIGTEELKSFFYGHILLITPQQCVIMLTMFCVVLFFHLVFFRQILFVSFDRVMAQTVGINVKLWDALFYFSLGGVIAVSTKAAGSLLVFGYLILPASTAVISTKRIHTMFVAAIFYALLASIVGLFVQHYFEYPPAQSIIGISSVLFCMVSVYQFKKIRIALAVATLCALFYFTYQSQLPPRHHFHHPQDHSRQQKNCLEIQVLTPFASIKKNSVLSLQITNHYPRDVSSYLQIDFSLDFQVIKVEIAAKETTVVHLTLDMLEMLEKNQEVLLSCWEDEMATISDDITIKMPVVLLR